MGPEQGRSQQPQGEQEWVQDRVGPGAPGWTGVDPWQEWVQQPQGGQGVQDTGGSRTWVNLGTSGGRQARVDPAAQDFALAPGTPVYSQCRSWPSATILNQGFIDPESAGGDSGSASGPDDEVTS